MQVMKRSLIFILLASLMVVSTRAQPGETLDALKKRYGTPAPQDRRDSRSAVWLFEGEDGQLAYSVTFDAHGKSIAEGLKPMRYAIFSRSTVQNFIDGPFPPPIPFRRLDPLNWICPLVHPRACRFTKVRRPVKIPG